METAPRSNLGGFRVSLAELIIIANGKLREKPHHSRRIKSPAWRFNQNETEIDQKSILKGFASCPRSWSPSGRAKSRERNGKEGKRQRGKAKKGSTFGRAGGRERERADYHAGGEVAHRFSFPQEPRRHGLNPPRISLFWVLPIEELWS